MGYSKEEQALYIHKLEAEIIRLKKEAEQREKSKGILEAFFQQAVSSAMILDRDYNILRVNEVYAQACAREVSNFPGHNLFEFYPSDYKEIFDQVVRTKENYNVWASPFTFPDHPEWGVTYWDWSLSPVLDSSGEVDLLIFVLDDVTKGIKVQEKLQESEDPYRSIFEHSLDGIILNLPDGTILSANPAACRMFGRTEAEICAVGRDGIFGMADPRVMQAIQKTGSYHGEMTLMRKDGTKFPGEVTSNRFKNRQGRTLSSMFVRDITARKQAEEALRLSEEKFSKAFHQSQTMMLISRFKDGFYLDVNDTFAEVFGYNVEDFAGKSALELDVWVNLQDRQEVQNQLCENGYIRDFECKFRRKSGEIGVARFSANLLYIDNEKYILFSAVDITTQKKAEEAMLLSEEKFSKIFYCNQTPMAITRLKDSTYIDVNDAYLEVMGYSREELIGKSVFADTNICCTDPNVRQEKFTEFFKTGMVKNFEHQVRKRTGEIIYALSCFNLIELDGEKCRLTSAIDITERKKAEEALRLSEEMFYKAFNANPLPMTIVSINNDVFMEVNEAYINKSGNSREELIGFCITNHWVDLRELDQFKSMIEKEGVIRNLEVRHYNKLGEIITILLSGVVINWLNEQCILAIANDITELKRYQQEAARLERLHLVGQMAAGIGHEVRNPMTTVRGFLQLLRRKERYAQDQGYMDLMIEELDRANAIINGFLSLARNKAVEKKRQSLNERIESLYPLLSADAMENRIDIQLELGAIPELLLDQNEIHQLILNLVRNGIEAMTPGGLLTIKTFQAGSDVVLAVQDQGRGMTPEVLEKIGTPFFTTKDTGTGIGLATCYSIAERHQARIEVETGPGRTTFYVKFKESQE